MPSLASVSMRKTTLISMQSYWLVSPFIDCEDGTRGKIAGNYGRNRYQTWEGIKSLFEAGKEAARILTVNLVCTFQRSTPSSTQLLSLVRSLRLKSSEIISFWRLGESQDLLESSHGREIRYNWCYRGFRRHRLVPSVLARTEKLMSKDRPRVKLE